MNVLDVLLVGCGTRGRAWATVLRESAQCQLAAIVDPDPSALTRFVDDFGVRRAYSSLPEALEAEDAIRGAIIASPPYDRYEQIRSLCEIQVPMLVEKPLALNLEEASRYVRLAKSTATPLMVGLNFRYLPVTQELRRLCDSRALGAPEFARFTYERQRDGHAANLNKYPLTMKQPMLWEQSVHHFDLMRYVYDAEPVSVFCHTWNPSWSTYADDANVSALIDFSTSMHVSYLGTWQGGWRQMAFEWRTDCSGGVILQKDMFQDLWVADQDDDALTQVELPPYERWRTDAAALLGDFLDTIVTRRSPPCSGEDHLSSLAMVEACARSSSTGQPVDVQELLATATKDD